MPTPAIANIVKDFQHDLSEILYRCLSKPDQILTHITYYFESMIKGGVLHDYSYMVTAATPIYNYNEIVADVWFDLIHNVKFTVTSNAFVKTKKNDPVSDYDRAMGVVGKQ